MMKNKCWVVKIGSALLTDNGKGIDKQLIARWVEQIVDLQAQNIDIIFYFFFLYIFIIFLNYFYFLIWS